MLERHDQAHNPKSSDEHHFNFDYPLHSHIKARHASLFQQSSVKAA